MAVNNDNESKSSSLLSNKKNKRLEEALSSYSPEKTKQAVGRLLEEYIDEGGKNYFGDSRRNTTLYFDDDYVTEIKKQSSQSKVPVQKEVPKTEKAAVSDEEKTGENSADLGNTTIYEPVGHEVSKNENVSAEDITADIESDEEEVVPRRRRASEAKNDNKAKKDKLPKKKKKTEPEPEIEDNYEDYDDDFEDEDYEDFDDDFESVKKKKFFGFFRKNNKDDDFDDEDDYYDDEYEDEEYDDDEYDDEDEYEDDEYDEDEDYDDEYDDDEDYDDEDYDYDDYDERGSVPVKKIFNIIFIIVLICVIAVLAAMCINYKNLYESADKQVNQNISEQESSELQSEIESLKTENEALKADVERYKGSGVVSGDADSDSESTTKSTTGTAAMTPNQADAASGGNDSSTPQGNAYTVKSGDTAQKITIGVYGEYTPELWEKLKKANGKGDSDWIAGEEVKVP